MLRTFSMHSSQRPLLFIPLLLAAVLITWYTWQSYQDVLANGRMDIPSAEYLRRMQDPLRSNDNLQDVQNSTLGFQEIRVISLPERTDKHDAWTVTASLAGFDYEIADGVDSSKISDKSLPYTMDRPPKIVACWRAHMNVLQDIVNRGVASTLVFEDDADWDVALRSQLVQFARGSQWLLNATSLDSSNPTVDFHSPYGPGWDFLWLGHCGAGADPWDGRRFVIPHDPTVEPNVFRTYGATPDMSPWEGASPPDFQARVVMSQSYGVCTAAYAISYEGARKALYHLSMQPYDAPVDWGYSDMCRDKKSGFTCIAPYPPLIGIHRPAGDISRWSDIEVGEGESQEAHSERVVFSYRMNLDRLLMGERIMKSTEGTAELTGVHEMDINDIGVAVGHEEEIEIRNEDGTDEQNSEPLATRSWRKSRR